jgi:hypothetical protein
VISRQDGIDNQAADEGQPSPKVLHLRQDGGDAQVLGRDRGGFGRLHRKVGKRKLPTGRYTATLIATDAAGNASEPATLSFTITRR